MSRACLSVHSGKCLCATDRDRAVRCSARCVSVCSITSETWQAQTLIQSGGGVSGERQGTYGQQMIFIGLKRSSWPAGLVATAGVMLHYDLKMTGDAAAPKQRGEKKKKRTCRWAEKVRPAAWLRSNFAVQTCILIRYVHRLWLVFIIWEKILIHFI